ncbi:hypothetical protein Tco_0889504 [Tanacetum coccineum]
MDNRWQQLITQEITVLVKNLLIPLAKKKKEIAYAFEYVLKKEMFKYLEYVQSLKKEVDELQLDKNEFSNEYDLYLQQCLTNNIMCAALSSMADIDEYSEMACKYMEKIKECQCLEIELSKQKDNVCKEVYIELLRGFAKLEKHFISLEIALQGCQAQLNNDKVLKEQQSTSFRELHEKYFEIQDLKAQLQDRDIAISEFKKLIEKSKGKSVKTKFDKPHVIRQTNAIRVPKPSVLGKQTPFSDSLEKRNFSKPRSVTKTDVSKGLSKPVTPQNVLQTQTRKQAKINKNVIKPGMYQLDTIPTQPRTSQLP